MENDKNETPKEEDNVLKNLKVRIEEARKLDERVKELGHDYLLKVLKDHNFPDPEGMVKEMLKD